MTDKWHGGKGDRPRKASNQKAYSDNYDRIFGKKQSQQEIDFEKEQLKKEQEQEPKNS
jgi:hypothetical protein